jgi:hypothetical protein
MQPRKLYSFELVDKVIGLATLHIPAQNEREAYQEAAKIAAENGCQQIEELYRIDDFGRIPNEEAGVIAS